MDRPIALEPTVLGSTRSRISQEAQCHPAVSGLVSKTVRKGRNHVARPPLPPFTRDTAVQKVRLAEDGWNSRDPEKVALAYTPDSQWLIKELWAFDGNRIAVRFAYEWHDDSGNWFRSYGNENWEFDEDGLMRLRLASINDLPIKESDRKYHWPLGRRPDTHPGLSELGL